MTEEPEDPIARMLSDALHEHVFKQVEHMDKICLLAVALGCGVRLTRHEDGGYTVSVDKEVPPMTIHEHVHG